MSGHVAGLQARVREVAKDCLYIHCCNHNLQLSLVQVAKIRSNGDPAILCNLECFNLVQAVYTFISSSPQRNGVYRNEQLAMGISNDNVRALQSLSDTRWSCRVKAFRNLKKTIPAVLNSLEFPWNLFRELQEIQTTEWNKWLGRKNERVPLYCFISLPFNCS